MRMLIKNGRVVDPLQDIDDYREVLLEDRKIQGIYPKSKGPEADRIIDASGCIVVPGMVDMHTHLREPGFEYKETIKTGTLAALKGGFTTVCCMPNTNPINDSIAVTEFIIEKASREGYCTVYPIGAITKGQKGQELNELRTLRQSGCIAFSDDGKPVTNSLIMRRVLEYSKIFDVPIISHCEDVKLSEGGVMNEGVVSTILGLKGIPKAAEEIMVSRDIALCELTRGRLHIAHVSTEGSVKLIRDAKKHGINVTAETCPHYFCLTDELVKSYSPNLKVNPPIRTKKDIEAIKVGLQDGTIDVIATDHAPHHEDDKNKEFDMAAFGISGIETAVSLGLLLVAEGCLTLKQLIIKMSVTPSNIMKLKKGDLIAGRDADITIINPDKEYTVDTSSFLSKGKNSPFHGWHLKGTIEKTISLGTIHEWS
jgi:dihydroorotase